jgi:hypothetical protein
MACIVPLLACATSLGILFFCGMRFSSILCVIPFLVLAIGKPRISLKLKNNFLAVDSSFLMIHEWQRVLKIQAENPKILRVDFRMAEVRIILIWIHWIGVEVE